MNVIISAFSVFLRVLLTSNLYLKVKGSFGDRSSYSSVFFVAMNQCMKQKEVNPFFGNLEKGEELLSLWYDMMIWHWVTVDLVPLPPPPQKKENKHKRKRKKKGQWAKFKVHQTNSRAVSLKISWDFCAHSWGCGSQRKRWLQVFPAFTLGRGSIWCSFYDLSQKSFHWDKAIAI